MKLIDDIIDDLTSRSTTLTDILIKTKVLAFKLKNQELIKWIDDELNGYTQGSLPEYRVLPCQVIGTMSNGLQRYKNYPLPLLGLDQETTQGMTTMYLSQSISTLDDFANGKNGGKMINHIPMEYYSFLSKDLDNGFMVEYAERKIDRVQVIQIMTAVRSKLLDFLLRLNEELGESNDIKEYTNGTEKDKISSIFSSVVFGNNTTIIVGDHNTQTVAISNNSTGNFEELKKLLIDAGVKERDIQELEVIIDTDNPNSTEKEFGTNVKSWVRNMLGKVLDNSWKISLGAAGKLLADAITRYYGWK